MSVIKITKSNFESEVLKSDKKVLVDFYADWCGPCRMVGPVVEEIANEYPEYKICKINVDEQPELAASFQVMSIPSLFVMENGKVINQALGAKTKTQLLEMLKE
ncbi:MAG: thioredoxin [Ruminococcaceae bacterium]|nr:thioredoxin [Oscillospiraceae bacterium]